MGKFYPFRPSSLLLLIWLVTLVAWLNELVLRPRLLRLVAGALVIPPFLWTTALHLRQDIKARAQIASDKAMIQDFLRGETPPDAVVLVDPAIEAFLGMDYSFLDIERTTHRFALVLFKFTPTNDPEILEWHRRMEFRRSTFERGCGTDPIYRRDYLLTMRDREGFLERSCGPSVLETGRFALLRTAGSAGSDAAQH